MIRTTITQKEFEQLTWMSFASIANTINDITVVLINPNTVQINVLGYEIKTMTVTDYNNTLNPSA